MNEIDWSKAPEGATHCTPAALHDINFRPVFWRVVDGVVREAWPMSNDYSKVKDHFRYGEGGCSSFDISHAVKRPAPAWTGEGLPPVGTVCEACVSGTDGWFKCSVLIHHPFEDGVAGVHDVAGHALLWTDTFRPIRTPEQIAAEEREKAIREMRHIAEHDAHSREVDYGALYDAGYRKVEGGAQ